MWYRQPWSSRKTACARPSMVERPPHMIPCFAQLATASVTASTARAADSLRVVISSSERAGYADAASVRRSPKIEGRSILQSVNVYSFVWIKCQQRLRLGVGPRSFVVWHGLAASFGLKTSGESERRAVQAFVAACAGVLARTIRATAATCPWRRQRPAPPVPTKALSLGAESRCL